MMVLKFERVADGAMRYRVVMVGPPAIELGQVYQADDETWIAVIKDHEPRQGWPSRQEAGLYLLGARELAVSS